MLRKIRESLEVRVGYFRLKLCRELSTFNNSSCYVDHRKCCQHSSTDNRRQFVTLSTHLCIQHDERETARPTGSSARAEACSFHFGSVQFLIDWLIDWLIELRFTSHLTQNKSFRRRFPKPISWLGLAWYGKKRNLTQQKHTFTNQKNVLQHKINTKN